MLGIWKKSERCRGAIPLGENCVTIVMPAEGAAGDECVFRREGDHFPFFTLTLPA